MVDPCLYAKHLGAVLFTHTIEPLVPGIIENCKKHSINTSLTVDRQDDINWLLEEECRCNYNHSPDYAVSIRMLLSGNKAQKYLYIL